VGLFEAARRLTLSGVVCLGCAAAPSGVPQAMEGARRSDNPFESPLEDGKISASEVDRFLGDAQKASIPPVSPTTAQIRRLDGTPVGVPRTTDRTARPLPNTAADPYARAELTRTASPPFGPERMPLFSEVVGAADLWERAYYEARPDEYKRFVELFGDIHRLR
jgi:hypothetical protein